MLKDSIVQKTVIQISNTEKRATKKNTTLTENDMSFLLQRLVCLSVVRKLHWFRNTPCVFDIVLCKTGTRNICTN